MHGTHVNEKGITDGHIDGTSEDKALDKDLTNWVNEASNKDITDLSNKFMLFKIEMKQLSLV